jgi:hypothetical protein
MFAMNIEALVFVHARRVVEITRAAHISLNTRLTRECVVYGAL